MKRFRVSASRGATGFRTELNLTATFRGAERILVARPFLYFKQSYEASDVQQWNIYALGPSNTFFSLPAWLTLSIFVIRLNLGISHITKTLRYVLGGSDFFLRQ